MTEQKSKMPDIMDAMSGTAKTCKELAAITGINIAYLYSLLHRGYRQGLFSKVKKGMTWHWSPGPNADKVNDE